ncbi:conserved exported hypothetical protein [Erythrobacter sp. EC-HK427]|nr:conserved exported hypothetical protein [Erythrobacter sp. EC-HK427]
MASMRRHAALLAQALSLSACATVPDAPTLTGGEPMPAGSVVALRQPVAVGDVVVTPMRVVEDSRCPINARCVWPGRLVVETRVDGAGWRETVPLTLGDPQRVRGWSISLVSGEPGQMAGSEPVRAEEYRLSYEGRLTSSAASSTRR